MSENQAQNLQMVPLEPKLAAEVEKIKSKLDNNNETALTLCSTSTNKKCPQVLEEDEYTGRLESIIERDFFPDVTKMRLELEYQDALEKNDFELLQKLNQARVDLAQDSIRGSDPVHQTPLTFETPLWREPTEAGASDKLPKPDSSVNKESQIKDENKHLTLNAFLSKYTSEDNASFEELQKEAIQKHKEKMDFLCADAQSHNQKVEASLALPSPGEDQSKSEKANSAEVISWKYTQNNTVMFEPEAAPFTQLEMEKMKSQQIIMHENTRFKAKPLYRRPASQTTSKEGNNLLRFGKIGIDGKEHTDGSTPSVNGFKLVPSTPSLDPEKLPDSPLMTWGEIECTPINIRGDATPFMRPDMTPSSHFTMPDIPQREKAGQELANRILSKKKTSRQAFNSGELIKGTERRKTGLERLNSMSPAAQLFATGKLGVHRNMDHSLQASYSPLMTSSLFTSQHTPTPRPRQTVTPSLLEKRTKSHTTHTNQSKSSSSTLHNRSNPSKRPKASEFF